MIPTHSKTAFEIQYVTDPQGQRIFVQIPLAQWERLQSHLDLLEKQGTTRSESPELIDEDGLLVVNATPVHDLSLAVEDERNRRMAELIGRIGL